MKRISLLLGVAGILVLGLLVGRGQGDSRPNEREQSSMSSEEYHYRLATRTPYSAFMRQE
jgi:hypothetical protein